MGIAPALVVLLAISSVVALAARALRTPYAVALVVAGLALGGVGALDAPRLSKDLLYGAFLPGLVFESAFHLDARTFWQNKIAILALAVPGVVVATAATAAALGAIPAVGLGAAQAVVFGAIVSATDPIAVVALVKTLGAPRRLGVVMEGESLVNDGTAVVLFAIAVAFAGGGASIAGAAIEFARVMALSVVAGAAVGFAASAIIRRIDDALVTISLTAVAAYGSFFAAESVHLSGILATLAAGMTCGSWGACRAQTRASVEAFWEYAAFALNSVVFLLVGIEVRAASLVASWRPIVIAFGVLLVVRAMMVGAVVGATRATRERMPWRWGAVLAWGGLRGALSMALAEALPAGFAARDAIVAITFGVVALTLLVNGVTAGPLIHALGIAKREAA